MRRTGTLVLIAVISLVGAVACRGARPVETANPSANASAPTPAGSSSFTGTVAETMKSGGYTYARLQGGKEDVWIAASEFETKAGDRLTVALDMPVQDFESKTLERTFPLIYFVSSVSREGERAPGAGAEGAAPALMTSHAQGAAATSVEPIARPAGSIAVSDVWAKRTELAGQQVTVRGKVTKVNEGILGRNWLHLQDGSGASADRTNDLTITTDEAVKLGEVITARGVLAIDKDFGAGYQYGAILENAKLSR